MKNTVGHTGIYAWGDCVRHRFFQKLRSNRRTKNPLPLGMGSVKIIEYNVTHHTERILLMNIQIFGTKNAMIPKRPNAFSKKEESSINLLT